MEKKIEDTGKQKNGEIVKKTIETLHHPKLHSTFWYLSRVFIILPIVIVFIALFMRVFQFYSDTKDREKAEESVLLTPTILPISKEKNTNNNNIYDVLSMFGKGLDKEAKSSSKSASFKDKINMEGPMVCKYTDQSMSADLQINDNKVYAKILKDGVDGEFILKDDCLYKWQSSTKKGNKVCEISFYLSMLGGLGMWGGEVNIEKFLFKLVGQEGGGEEESLKKFIESCEEKSVDESIFEEPSDVEFAQMSSLLDMIK